MDKVTLSSVQDLSQTHDSGSTLDQQPIEHRKAVPTPSIMVEKPESIQIPALMKRPRFLRTCRTRSMESTLSDQSTRSYASEGSLFSWSSEVSSCWEEFNHDSPTATVLTCEKDKPKHSLSPYRISGVFECNNEPPSSKLVLYETKEVSNTAGVLDLVSNNTEPLDEETASEESSISRAPSQGNSSRTSISRSSSGEDMSSQISSSLASSTQDGSSSASLESDSELSNEEFVRDSLSSSRSRLIDILMKELHVTLSFAMESRTCPGTKSGSCNDSNAVAESPTLRLQGSGAVEESSVGCSKRWQKEEGEADQDEDDDTQRRRRKSNQPSEAVQAPEIRFACPFFKHSPYQHKARSCRYPGFKGVHRVKEHLYRCHVSIHCNRCHTIFQTEDELQNHQRLTQPCAINLNASPEGLSATQIARLKSKKRFSSEKTEEEKWRAVYHFLFPGVPVMSVSPYCDDPIEPPEGNELDEFEVFSRREFPRRVRQRLDSLYEDLAIDTTMRAELTNIANQCREEIFAEFQKRQQDDTVELIDNKSRPIDPRTNLTMDSQPLNGRVTLTMPQTCEQASEVPSALRSPSPAGWPLGEQQNIASFRRLPSVLSHPEAPVSMFLLESTSVSSAIDGIKTYHEATVNLEPFYVPENSSMETIKDPISDDFLDELLSLHRPCDSDTWKDRPFDSFDHGAQELECDFDQSHEGTGDKVSKIPPNGVLG